MVQGITPRKLALTIALGICVGILPLLWGSTLICALLAFAFGLNQAGIQAVNYLTYPLQLALLVPFYRLGTKVFPWEPHVASQLLQGGHWKDFGGNVTLLAVATLKAVAVWLLVAPPVAFLLYIALLSVFARMPSLKDEDLAV
jgi:uncharacterized protein DUF2062